MTDNKKRLPKDELERLIEARQFEDIFTEYLGWDLPDSDESVTVELDDESFLVQVIAQKKGYAICVCDMGENFDMPVATRRRFVRKLSKLYYEHLLITLGDGRQRWSVAIRPQNRPLKLAEAEYDKDKDIQSLLEKLDGLIFSLSDEDEGITDVVDRVHNAFVVNAEKITKQFYGKFKDELSVFAKFIDGIQERVSREWYASLMLNRLMFIYFIQKKGFLNGEYDYLQKRLQRTKERWGKDKFHSEFYRRFLRRLFHEGLDMPMESRTDEINELLGNVPYLNGGLFDTHSIEIENKISIPDKAFEELFSFFDKYHWHLDDRPTASGNEINPDVIGYIFEKYINDRAAMGAYYTQEDITGYIARNTIIPFLLRRVQKECPSAFAPDGDIWRLLRDSPDNYIYAAVRYGCDLPDEELPDYIQVGLDPSVSGLLDRRHRWNEIADDKFALPTETWREVIARRQKYRTLRKNIEAGEVCEIDDLITYNLDIQRFAGDALGDCGNADFIQKFFIAIAGRGRVFKEDRNVNDVRGISVLDPACGSGAFLFAALRVLEQLYERCLERISGFVAQDDRRLQNDKKGHPRHPFFRAVLHKIDEHPNQPYWIYKTIILNNLFGVDLMPEAAEIAKLRLFLKLAAEAEYKPEESNLGLEPLPDIDHNIRTGNSLVGFASMEDFEKKTQQELDLDNLQENVRESAKTVAKASERFRQAQDGLAEDYVSAKKGLNERLRTLNDRLDELLGNSYGADNSKKLKQWKKTHQPFHWLAEFYDIIENNDGFDVIVGNPPYVEYSKVKKEYAIKNYDTEKCGNLYAFFIERSLLIGCENLGLIIPISFPSTPRMAQARALFDSKNLNFHIANFADRPSTLFNGVHQKLTIFLANQSNKRNCFTTNFLHWYRDEKNNLFAKLTYQEATSLSAQISPKIGNLTETDILHKIIDQQVPLQTYMETPANPYSFHLNMRLMFWVKCFLSPKSSGEYKTFYAGSNDEKEMLMSILNSTVFFWFWEVMSDCWHLTNRELMDFAFDIETLSSNSIHKLANLGKELERDLEAQKVYVGTRQTDYEYYHRKSKHTIDEIDKVLAVHYGFTEEELDYIINYDIKYRMGGGK